MTAESALVTGCSAGGIGAAVALALAQRGVHVFATARNTAKVPAELASLSNVTVLELDVLSDASVAGAAKVVGDSAPGGGLDVLINNAGGGYAQPVLDIDIERAKRLYDVNVWGPVRTIQAFASLLIARRGRIVNISSVGAIVPTPWIAAYASSKAALTNISETLRLELAPFGVDVMTVMAGVVTTQFHANDTDFSLPPKSLYTAIQDIMSKWATGEAKPKGCSAEEFAESLMEDIVGKSTRSGLIWRGPHSSAVRFMVSWLPAFLVDKFMSEGQGLKELSAANSRTHEASLYKKKLR